MFKHTATTPQYERGRTHENERQTVWEWTEAKLLQNSLLYQLNVWITLQSAVKKHQETGLLLN